MCSWRRPTRAMAPVPGVGVGLPAVLADQVAVLAVPAASADRAGAASAALTVPAVPTGAASALPPAVVPPMALTAVSLARARAAADHVRTAATAPTIAANNAAARGANAIAREISRLHR